MHTNWALTRCLHLWLCSWGVSTYVLVWMALSGLWFLNACTGSFGMWSRLATSASMFSVVPHYLLLMAWPRSACGYWGVQERTHTMLSSSVVWFCCWNLVCCTFKRNGLCSRCLACSYSSGCAPQWPVVLVLLWEITRSSGTHTRAEAGYRFLICILACCADWPWQIGLAYSAFALPICGSAPSNALTIVL